MPARLIRIALMAFAVAAGATGLRAEPLNVFAAASLTDVLGEIGAQFHNSSGTEVRFSFAASSTLARQIEAGAPADVVALASTGWAEYLAGQGLIGEAVSPASNRLVLVAPPGTPAPDRPLSADGLAALLGPDGRMAIGDPAHVPAGIYARQALEALGLWGIASDRLAMADNVRAALALVAHGQAALGIVYATDAAIADVTVLAQIPQSAHAPIAYPFAIIRDRPVARAFLSFVTGDTARAIFRRHGFQVE